MSSKVKFLKSDHLFYMFKLTADPSITRRDVFHWALCIPASCTPQDLQGSLNSTLDTVFSKYNIRGVVSVDPEYCHKHDDAPIPFSLGYFITMYVIRRRSKLHSATKLYLTFYAQPFE